MQFGLGTMLGRAPRTGPARRLPGACLPARRQWLRFSTWTLAAAGLLAAVARPSASRTSRAAWEAVHRRVWVSIQRARALGDMGPCSSAPGARPRSGSGTESSGGTGHPVGSAAMARPRARQPPSSTGGGGRGGGPSGWVSRGCMSTQERGQSHHRFSRRGRRRQRLGAGWPHRRVH